MSDNGRLKVRSLHELLAMEPPEILYIIEPQILSHAGSMFIYGRAGSWKSWLATDMAFSVADGQAWLMFKTQQARVLLIQSEVVEAMHQDRIQTFVNKRSLYPSELFFATDTELRLDGFFGLAQLEVALKEYKPQVVVLDNLFSVLSGSESDELVAKRMTAGVSTLRSKYNVAFVIIHHPSKLQYDSGGHTIKRGFEQMSGHSIWNRWADTVMAVDNEKDEDIIEVSFEKMKNAQVMLPAFRLKVHRDRLKFSLY